MFRKKLKNIFLFILLFLVAAEITAVISNNLYFEKVANKEVARRSMSKSSGNAVKHAYAASLIYSTLRTFFFTEDAAKNITVFLGKSNEIAEVIFKPHQDSTLEMIKDMQNNLLGICVAQWMEENKENPATEDRISLMGNFAERKKLILSRDDVVLDDATRETFRKSFSYSLAAKWMEENDHKLSCNLFFDEETLEK